MIRSEQATGVTGKVDKRTVLIVAVIASFLTPFMSSSVNIALPSIGREFSADAVSLGWIATTYLLAGAVFLVPFGKLADIYGRKRIFLYGVVGYTAMSILSGLATSEGMLIVFRTLQGLTNAMMFGTSTAILTSVYPPQARGRVLGMAAAGLYMGLTAGPFIGGVITQYIGWRAVFFATALLGTSVIVLVVRNMRAEWAGARGQKLDLIGSGFYAVTLLAVLYGFTALPAISGVWLILMGLVGLAAFILWESRVSNPVMDVRLFRHNTVYALSNLAALINHASTFALTFLLSLYLQYIKGLDPQIAGLILLSQPAMQTIFAPLSGRLSDRIEPRIVSSVGMGLSAVGLLLLALSSTASGYWHIIVALIFCGLGFGTFASPNTNAIMSSVDRTYYGVAAATTSSMRLIGQVLSMAIATSIIAVFVGNVQITPQYYPAFQSAFRLAFIVFVVLCVAGVLASLARGRVRVGDTPTGAPPLEKLTTGN